MARRDRKKAAQRKRNREADRRRRKKIPAWPLFIASALVAAIGIYLFVRPPAFAMSGGTGPHGNRPTIGLVNTDGARILACVVFVAAIGILLVGIQVVRSQRRPPNK